MLNCSIIFHFKKSKMYYFISSFYRVFAILLLLVGTAPWSQAATDTWTGTGSDLLWSTAANWNTSRVPTSSDDVTLGTTFSSGSNITVSGTNYINSLTYNPGTGVAPNLVGGTIEITTGNITVGTGNTAKAGISSNLLIAGSAGPNVWTINSSTLEILGQIASFGAGTPTITTTGSGMLALSNASQNYTGNWNLSTDLTTKSDQAFGSGAVTLNKALTNWVFSGSAVQTISNNITFTTAGQTFLSTAATSNVTLTGQLGGISTRVLFNSSAVASTVHINGTFANAFTGNSGFFINGTVNLDTTGRLTGLSYINPSGNNYGGTLNWTVAETIASSTAFICRSAVGGGGNVQTYAQLGMLASGTTTINGQCKLNNSSALTDGSDLWLNTVSGGTLVLAGQVTDSLSATARALSKIGSGTAVLSANTNDFRGGTTVSAGTLLIDNTSGSGTGTGSVSVSGGGATFGGTGIIAPTGANGIAVASGGFIAPGDNGIGTLTINLGGTTGTVAMASGSGFKYELGTANVSIGTIAAGSSDRLALTGASAGDFTFNLNNVDFSNTGSAGYYKLFSTDLNLATTWIGLTFDASTGVVSSGLTFSGLAAGLTGGTLIVGTGSGGGFNGGTVGDIYFYSSTVPEPSTWALLAFSLAAVVVFRRKHLAPRNM